MVGVGRLKRQGLGMVSFRENTPMSLFSLKEESAPLKET